MSRSRWAVVAGLVLPVLLLAAIYATLAWVTGNRLPSRATLLGVAVGGLTPAEADARVEPTATELAAEPVHLDLDTEGVDLPANRLGLSVDARATLAAATGFTLDPRELWRRLDGGGPLTPVTRFDPVAASATLGELAGRVDRDLEPPSVTFPGGRVVVVRGSAGLRRGAEAPAAAIEAAWPGSRRVTGTVHRTEPQVPPGEVDLAVERLADRAVSGPVHVVVGRSRTDLAPAVFAPALRMRPQGATLVLDVDAPTLAGILATAVPGTAGDAADATVRLVDGAPKVVPGRNGHRLDPAPTAAAMRAALTSAGRVAAVHTVAAAPNVTTQAATNWGITAVVGSADVAAADGLADPAATANAATAAARLDGALVRPGAALGLLATLGDPTTGGFVPARTLSGSADGGQGVVGAGADLTASALAAAAYGAGLDVTRTTHRVWDPAYAEGLDADLRWPDVDLGVRAPADSAVLVQSAVRGGRVQVRLWGRPGAQVSVTVSPRIDDTPATDVVGPASGCVSRDVTRPGFVVDVRRMIGGAGRPTRSDSARVTYEALGRVECPGDPASAVPTDGVPTAP